MPNSNSLVSTTTHLQDTRGIAADCYHVMSDCVAGIAAIQAACFPPSCLAAVGRGPCRCFAEPEEQQHQPSAHVQSSKQCCIATAYETATERTPQHPHHHPAVSCICFTACTGMMIRLDCLSRLNGRSRLFYALYEHLVLA